MATSTSSNSNSKQSQKRERDQDFQQPRSLGNVRYPRHWVVFGVCLIVGVLLAVALLSYDQAQIADNTTAIHQQNLVGALGAWSCYLFLKFLGISTWLLPIFLLWLAFTAIRNARFLAITRFLAMLLCIITFAALARMFGDFFGATDHSNYYPYGPGGALGTSLYDDFFLDFLGPVGSALILLVLYVIGMMLVFTKDIFAEFEKIAVAMAAWRERRAQASAERAEMRHLQEEAIARERARRKAGFEDNPAAPGAALYSDPAKPDVANADKDKPAAVGKNAPQQSTATDAGTLAGDDDLPPVDDPETPASQPKIIRGSEPAAATSNATKSATGLAIVKPEETKKAKNAAVPVSEANYIFPPLTLLSEHPKTDDIATDEEYAHNMAALIRIIGEFGFTVTAGEIHVGPVITCYEVVPAPGVRVEKIANLDKNIALHMSAQSVRILAPIPGKAAIGIEMPNKVPSPVGMRDIIESEAWVNSKAEIPIALGKDVSGAPLISDLTKMPHLLIAGATGSGKSVCINSIIASLVYRKSPKDVRLIMVDPKVVELKVFNTLPHMFIPVVTEPKKVPAALKWLLGEMEKRYKWFGKVGVRNISGFNNRKKDSSHQFPDVSKNGEAAAPAEGEQTVLEGVEPANDLEPPPDHLPYIVAIIDELADLMMVAAAEVETSIARLAQLARAAGIHIIIATQRPSVNVITGIIKANLPSRIAFQVASQVDSRTILDGKGAESLIGRGDMLFTPPGTSRLVRAQGAFVSDEEVKDFVEFLKKNNGLPQYAQDVQEQIDSAPIDGEEEDEKDFGDMDDQELCEEALKIVKVTRRASTSALQRKLGIGYNRAARMMDMLEERGIVGPENGSKPREILADLDSL